MVTATTTDPATVFAVVFATGAGTLLTLLLLKLLIDTVSDHHTEQTGPAPARQTVVLAHCPPMPPAHTRHAHARPRPTACDETTPLTTVTAGHGRHRKDA